MSRLRSYVFSVRFDHLSLCQALEVLMDKVGLGVLKIRGSFGHFSDRLEKHKSFGQKTNFGELQIYLQLVALVSVMLKHWQNEVQKDGQNSNRDLNMAAKLIGASNGSLQKKPGCQTHLVGRLAFEEFLTLVDCFQQSLTATGFLYGGFLK